MLSHGIRAVFGIPGGTIAPIFDALEAAGIELVICQHETMAVHAAAGYAHVSGRPGVVAVTSGPGALNALNGLASAGRDELSVLVLAGEADERNFGRSLLQDGSASGLDLLTVARRFTKYAELVLRPERATVAVEHALSTIAQRPQGAAFISLPFNISSCEAPPQRRRFQLEDRSEPDEGICKELVEVLIEAHEKRARCALMLGVAAKRARLGPLVLELAQALHIPVFTDIEGKGVFPERHPLSLGVFGVGHRGRAHAYLAEPLDLLVTIGCRLDDTTTLGYAEALGADCAHLIQLDHDPDRIARSYAPQLTICADLRATLEGVLTSLPSLRGGSRARELQLGSRSEAELVNFDSVAPHDPRHVAPTVQELLGPKTVFCCDIGNHMLFTAQSLTVDHPDGFWVCHGLGGMGSGIGTAIGMQLAHGSSRQVVAVCGDGGILMYGCELATCARYSIPLITLVFNDGQLGMVAHGFRGLFGRTPDFSTPPWTSSPSVARSAFPAFASTSSPTCARSWLTTAGNRCSSTSPASTPAPSSCAARRGGRSRGSTG